MLKEIFRFIGIGLINTVISYLLYLFALVFFPYIIAFSMSYVLSIFTSYVLQARFVFSEPIRLNSALKFPLLYGLLYFLNLALLSLCVDYFFIDEVFAPVAVLVVMVPVSFVLSRLLIKNTEKIKCE